MTRHLARRCAHPPEERRAKAAEAAFLSLYQRLYEAPDPSPALAAGLEAASRASQLEAEAAKMAQAGAARAELGCAGALGVV